LDFHTSYRSEVSLTFAISLCLLSWLLPSPWAVAAAIGSIVAASVVVYNQIQGRRHAEKRAQMLKKPFDTVFYIPKLIEHEVKYHKQSDTPYYEGHLRLSANAEHDIMIRSRARLDVVLSEIQYGCMDYEQSLDLLKAMPEPLCYFNPWVKKGTGRKIIPESDASGQHYVDAANVYHIKFPGGNAVPKGHDILHGLTIRTKKDGEYHFRVAYVMRDGEGESILPITVAQ
jgi:hypothetical protein